LAVSTFCLAVSYAASVLIKALLDWTDNGKYKI
jgi:hypothetical protein